MFLSKCLTNPEMRYGPSELEVACFVWACRRLRTVIYSNNHPVIVLTDHSFTKGIVEQTKLDTSLTDRANRRLINASIYLSSYALKLYYLLGILNFVPNALSRLKVVGDVTLRPKGDAVLDEI